MLWNQAVHTDREVTANRPDIIIKNKKEKTCTLIDVAGPNFLHCTCFIAHPSYMFFFRVREQVQNT